MATKEKLKGRKRKVDCIGTHNGRKNIEAGNLVTPHPTAQVTHAKHPPIPKPEQKATQEDLFLPWTE